MSAGNNDTVSWYGGSTIPYSSSIGVSSTGTSFIHVDTWDANKEYTRIEKCPQCGYLKYIYYHGMFFVDNNYVFDCPNGCTKVVPQELKTETINENDNDIEYYVKYLDRVNQDQEEEVEEEEYSNSMNLIVVDEASYINTRGIISA